MDVRLQLRLKRDWINGAPAASVRDARPNSNLTGALRRNHVDDRGLMPSELGFDRLRARIHADDSAACGQPHPLNHPRIKLLPRRLEQALLGERVLRVKDEKLATRLVTLEIVGDQTRSLIGSGRAAERVGGSYNDDGTPILHYLKLPAQQKGLLSGLPGMRQSFGCFFAIARQRVEAEVDARREHQPVVVQDGAVRERDAAGLRIDSRRAVRGQSDPLGPQRVVSEALRFERAQARDDL